MSFKLLRIALIVFCALNIKAQTFDVEQTSQLIRPRIKLDSKYSNELVNPIDSTHGYKCFENSIGFTFPIKRKFKTEINLDLSNFKLKDLFKKNIRIKASEIMGTFKVTQRQIDIGRIDSNYSKNLYYVNAGIIGLHLTKKYRIVFYSLNMSVHEEDKTFNQFTPRFSGVIGQYHIKGLRKSFYYGFSMIYSDGLFVPSPFIGGTEPINDRLSFNYILPVQLNLQYRYNKSYTLLGIKTDGYRSGIRLGSGRINMNYGNVAAFANFRYRFSRTFQAQAECGYNFYQFMSFDSGLKSSKVWPNRSPWPVNGGFYVNASLNIYFGKSLLEKVTDQLF